jgi:hypothetical protein
MLNQQPSYKAIIIITTITIIIVNYYGKDDVGDDADEDNEGKL